MENNSIPEGTTHIGPAGQYYKYVGLDQDSWFVCNGGEWEAIEWINVALPLKEVL